MKTAIIGMGRMGRRHVKVVRTLGLDLVGVCDQNSAALQEAAKEWDIPAERLFNSADEMLARTGPACVIIATTAPSHCAYVSLAVELGARYILCEKPMAVSLAECDRMSELCRQRDIELAINHQMRFMEQYIEAKRIVWSEDFGGLSSIILSAGNIGMAMNGIHYFEMFRYLTDEAPQEVTAWFSDAVVPNPRGPQFEDRAGSVRLTTAKGVRFYMEIGADQGHGLRVIYAGPYGQLLVDEMAGSMALSVREKQYRELPTTRYGMPWVESTLKIEPADAIKPSVAVLDALLHGRAYPNGQDGRLAIASLLAAYVSAESGHRAVRIDGNLPADRVFPWA